MRPIPKRAYVFIAITCLVAVPFVALGVQDVLGDEPPTVAFYIWALVVLLSLRPIRIAPNIELSASEVAVLATASSLMCAASLVPMRPRATRRHRHMPGTGDGARRRRRPVRPGGAIA